MLIVFSDEQLQILASFAQRNLDQDALKQFIEIIENYVSSVVVKDDLKSFGEGNSIDPTSLQNYVKSYAFLLTEGSKYKISDSDFLHSLQAVEQNEFIVKELTQVYQRQKNHIRELLVREHTSLPHYRDLSWRLEVPVASRRHPVGTDSAPHFLFKLDTESYVSPKSGKADNVSTTTGRSVVKETQILVCDIPNIVHLSNELDKAARELQAVHTRRILRLYGAHNQ